LRSLFYLHSQPPGFNLLLGLVFRLLPGHEATAFQVLYLALGLTTYLTLDWLLRRLAVPPVVAAVVATAFMASPPFILYENYLFYTFPVLALVVGSTALLDVFLRGGRAWAAWLFFAAVAVLALLRTPYHLVWILLVAAGLYAATRRRVVLVAALLPVLTVGSWYLKNQVVFGFFGPSSWMGLNFAHALRAPAPAALRRLVDAGVLSPLVLADRFTPPRDYPPELRDAPGFEDIPAVRALDKSDGQPNMNHLSVIAMSRRYLHETLRLLTVRPRTFLGAELRSWYFYFLPASDYSFLDENRAAMGPVVWLYERVLCGTVNVGTADDARGNPYLARVALVLVVGLPLLVAFGLRRLRRPGLDRAQRVLLGYVVGNIVVLSVIVNLFEAHENHRFRFELDGLYAILLGLFAAEVVARMKARRGRA
jgi:hypothetical protein